MFLFSATFFPVTAFPAPVRWVVELTPLYRGVVLCRELTTGVGDLGVAGLGRLPAGRSGWSGWSWCVAGSTACC